MTTDRSQAYGDALAKAAAATSIDVESRRIDLSNGRSLHLLEAGEGDPLVLVHGAGTTAVQWLPLMAAISGRRLIALDRPGYGSSDPVEYGTRIRETAVSTLRGVLDALSLPDAAFVGNSMGSIWATWLALDDPGRVRALVHLGAMPLLPGFGIPVPLRMMAVPGLGEVLARIMMTPTPSAVRRMLDNFGEGATLSRHEGQVDSLVAMYGSDTFRRSMLAEQRAIISPAGARPSFRFAESDLGKVRAPTLFVWGSHDPVADVSVGRHAVDLFANAHLEELPTAHMPWLGEPERTSGLVSDFLDRTARGRARS